MGESGELQTGVEGQFSSLIKEAIMIGNMYHVTVRKTGLPTKDKTVKTT